jgi:UbiD family decarboxylase
MPFHDLRSFLKHLEARGQLARIRVPVDPDQEITVIQHRVLAENGPALLFERLKGSPHRLVTNLFGTRQRVDMVFGGPPVEVGNRLVRLFEDLMPPSLPSLWRARHDLLPLSRARLRTVKSGPVMETITQPPDLMRLPVLTCWPGDGGPFFTLPLVHTTDPRDGRGNLAIYRLQRFGKHSTGMHWQIEKGGGFHFERAVALGRPLPVSVALGGPPALVMAAVAPLPEGMDERLLAALMMGTPLDVIRRQETGHRIPARAEFVLEGSVQPGDMHREGPFGDHFGHYSGAADFPVLRVDRVLARQDAIYPATVVGKPVQEDFYIGEALQEMSQPLLKIVRPAVTAIWAYPETGFHALAVMSVRERYPREALKHTLGMLGEGQVSLTKVMITVNDGVDVADFTAVSRALWRRLDTDTGIHILPATAQDTLDFTGPAMNTGSRLILLAAGDGPAGRQAPPPPPPLPEEVHTDIDNFRCVGPSFLMVRLKNNHGRITALRRALAEHQVTAQYLFQVLLSPDVPLDDDTLLLWGWFTRFDPLADLHPARRSLSGNRVRLKPPILIDARWKKGYPQPVAFDPEVEKRVAARWKEYGL